MGEIEIINKLQKAFTNDSIKKQVLEPCWYQLNIERNIDSTGFCYYSSEVLYRLTGESKVWMVKRLIDPIHWNNGTHYFLSRKSNDEIVDITSNQYTERSIKIPYELGIGRGLRNVSGKAKLLSYLSGLGEI